MALRGKDIAVIGAGVVGLSTALSLQEEFPLANITIFADKFNNETLSSGAGGIFRPEINVYHDEERVRTWCKDSLSHFLDILKSSESSEAGMQLISGYHLSTMFSDFKNDLVQELVPAWRKVNDKELQLFPSHFKFRPSALPVLEYDVLTGYLTRGRTCEVHIIMMEHP